eukprot:2601254-Rhodomonas_salina.1
MRSGGGLWVLLWRCGRGQREKQKGCGVWCEGSLAGFAERLQLTAVAANRRREAFEGDVQRVRLAVPLDVPDRRDGAHKYCGLRLLLRGLGRSGPGLRRYYCDRLISTGGRVWS